MCKRKSSRGFTLLELLVVISIVFILAGLLFPLTKTILSKAEEAVCASHLRNLWLAFSTRINDGQGWPQVPENISIGSIAGQRWWIEMSKESMGIPEKTWQCPTIARSIRSTNSSQQNLISYMPTIFDSKPETPNMSRQMPWFVEIGSVHGTAPKMVAADGAVVSAGTTPKPQ